MNVNYKLCPKCGKEIRLLAHKCKYCGCWVDAFEENKANSNVPQEFFLDTTKACPFCGEEIKTEAKKCKHCGEWFIKCGATKNKDIIEEFFVGVIKVIKFIFSCVVGYYIVAFIGLIIFIVMLANNK